MSNLIVKTTNLVKSFRNTAALIDVNLQVPRGISGFIGKNGAGKTTTIGVLLGLLKPDAGEATILGLDCWRDSFEIRRRLGVMHEVNAYPGNFTGKHFLKYVGRIYGVTITEQSINESLKSVGLVNSGDNLIKTYSAGMIRRLGLAQALLCNPEFVILDEPTANIDPLGRIELLDRIKEMHKTQGTSFLISTHILGDLEKICNWLSIIYAGKIVDQGNVKDLAQKYSANIYRIQVSSPVLFAEKVQALDTVEKIWMEDSSVYCKVKDPVVFCSEVPKIAVIWKLQLNSFQLMSETLEEIYTKTSSSR